MKSEGLHGVIAAAHELKTPLALMSHLAAVLQDDTFELTPAERKQLAQRIHLSAERSLALVRGLTLAERFEDADQMALQFKLEPLNIDHICREAMYELQPLATAHRQTLRLASARQLHLAVANPQLLKSVCYNLIDNAIRHTNVQGEIVISITKAGQFVRLGIRDSGPKPAVRDLLKLGNTLGRQVQPLSNRPGSSGLGLYIAARMTEAMGGSLGIRQRQAGVEFYAKLVQSKQLPLL